jgi:hypothetical protein
MTNRFSVGDIVEIVDELRNRAAIRVVGFRHGHGRRPKPYICRRVGSADGSLIGRTARIGFRT